MRIRNMLPAADLKKHTYMSMREDERNKTSAEQSVKQQEKHWTLDPGVNQCIVITLLTECGPLKTAGSSCEMGYLLFLLQGLLVSHCRDRTTQRQDIIIITLPWAD